VVGDKTGTVRYPEQKKVAVRRQDVRGGEEVGGGGAPRPVEGEDGGARRLHEVKGDGDLVAAGGAGDR